MIHSQSYDALSVLRYHLSPIVPSQSYSILSVLWHHIIPMVPSHFHNAHCPDNLSPMIPSLSYEGLSHYMMPCQSYHTFIPMMPYNSYEPSQSCDVLSVLWCPPSPKVPSILWGPFNNMIPSQSCDTLSPLWCLLSHSYSFQNIPSCTILDMFYITSEPFVFVFYSVICVVWHFQLYLINNYW